MVSHARSVRRLSLRAPSDELAARGSALLQDALHTATFPGDAGGAYVVIQRLALGRISANASPASIALRLEHAVADAASMAVPYDDSGAIHAEAVRFPGRAAALIALAARHSARLPTDAWFWEALVPGWQVTSSRSGRFRLLLDSVSKEPDAIVLVATIVARAVAARCGRELFESVREMDAVRWLTGVGWLAAAGDPVFDANDVAISQWAATACRLDHGWAADDIRVVWLATALAIHDNPARAADPQLPARISARLDRSFSVSLEDIRGAASEDRAARAVADQRSGVSLMKSEGRRLERETTRVNLGNEVADAKPPTSLVSGADDVEQAQPAVDRVLAERSEFAGLLFVIPILVRCGFVDHLRASPALLDARFAERLLGYIARRCGAGDDDPLALLFPFEHGRDDDALRRWMNVVRKWSRRHGRLGLIALTRRPGRVFATETHLDIEFDLSQLDVRVRRAALDVDPGWVPWLGRVVQFIYTDSRDRTR